MRYPGESVRRRFAVRTGPVTIVRVTAAAGGLTARPQEPAITLDPRSPLVLDVHDLSRRPGSMREESRTVAAPADMGTDVIAVPEGAEIDLDLRLESVMEGVLVTGTVTGEATGECVRCLDEVVHDVDVTITELFYYPDRAEVASAAGEDEDEVHVLEGELLDLEGVIRDSVVPALPFQPLCQPDCPGLCPQCGARLADDPNHQHEIIDPRWSALRGVLQDVSTPDETKES